MLPSTCPQLTFEGLKQIGAGNGDDEIDLVNHEERFVLLLIREVSQVVANVDFLLKKRRGTAKRKKMRLRDNGEEESS